MITTYKHFLFESNNVKDLQKKLRDIDNWFEFNNYSSVKWQGRIAELDKLREEQENKAIEIRRELFALTGDYYGITKEDKAKEAKKPRGLNSKYDHPLDVPKTVYKWLSKHSSLLTDDASDAVRWYRIINSRFSDRYPSGEMTIYRAVDNKEYDEIREGDWVTDDIEYAQKHNDMYFNGEGKIISLDVDGRDVLKSPTGNYEEAIYAPYKLSFDVNY